MRVIVDTNVLVSGLISETGAPARVVDAILGGELIPVLAQFIRPRTSKMTVRDRKDRPFLELAATSPQSGFSDRR